MDSDPMLENILSTLMSTLREAMKFVDLIWWDSGEVRELEDSLKINKIFIEMGSTSMWRQEISIKNSIVKKRFQL